MKQLLPFINSFGISVHISALREDGDFGIGDISHAYKFIDFLSSCDLNIWKMLPINSITKVGGYSPYDAESPFALDFIYCDLNRLHDSDSHIKEYIEGNKPIGHEKEISYKIVKRFKGNVLQLSFNNFYEREYLNNSERFQEFSKFIIEEKSWLEDYALFKVLKRVLEGKKIMEWPKDIRERNRGTLDKYLEEYKKEILYEEYIQWIMHNQWLDLHNYANGQGIYLIGDVPIYISFESPDVWKYREYFDIDEDFKPNSYGGAPPDYFSKEGQIWKMPTYNWQEMKKDDYSWWKMRLIKETSFFDGLRLDHFRGFIQYWEVPIDQSSAQGSWKNGPGKDFLFEIAKEIEDKRLNLIWVENLGNINKEIEDIRKELGLAGYMVFVYYMRQILENAESIADTNAQTSTHDSYTLTSFWKKLSLQEREYISKSLGLKIPEDLLDHMRSDLRWKIIEKILSEDFQIVAIPIQDILGENEQINNPTTIHGNWKYRMKETINEIYDSLVLKNKLKSLAEKYSRGKYFKEFSIKTIPWIQEPVRRIYKVGEEMHFWVLSENTSNIDASTSIPIEDDLSLDEKTIPFVIYEKYNEGYLMHAVIRASRKGTYYLRIKEKDSIKNDLIIEII